MRLENSARNVKAAWLWQFIHILCQFVTRTAIIKVLTIEYVGLSGLFSNVLSMLSLAELGIGEAIIFSLYSPIANDNKKNISAIMTFYKKIYICIGCFIIIAGVALMPYIGVFIKDIPKDIPNIEQIYLIFVINSAVSYFFSYKAAFITASQKDYIVILNNGITEIFMVIIQIGILILTKNYIAYLIIGVIFVFIKNIAITVVANKMYPYLRKTTQEKIPKDIFSSIKRNTGAMVLHKIGSIVVFSTDNLIISKFVGLVSVGLYTNYHIIINAIQVFINKIFSAMTASVGNLAVKEDIVRQEKILDNIVFLNFWLYVFSCCALLCLINPFIGVIWLGDSYLFSNIIVLLLVIKLYITGMRSSIQTFRNAKGLYWQNKFMPIAEAIINIVASVILVNYFGVAGVIVGTIISSILTCVWVEPKVVYKYGFNKSPKSYYIKYIKYFIVFIIIMIVNYMCISLIEGESIGNFVIKCIISCCIPNLLMYLLYRKTAEYKYMKGVVLKVMKKL